MTTPKTVTYGITFAGHDTVHTLSIYTVARGHILPSGAEWLDEDQKWWTRALTEEVVASEIAIYVAHVKFNKKIFQGEYFYHLLEGKLPDHHLFRQAWRMNENGDFFIDMARARTMHMDKIREYRNAALDELDSHFIIALEKDDTAKLALVKEKKQALRDLPATFDLSSAVDCRQLIELWPTHLINTPKEVALLQGQKDEQ